MQIDVLKRPAKRKLPVGWIVIALMIAVFVLSKRTEQKSKPTPTSEKAIVIVPPIGQAASVKVDEWADANGYELRRYSEDADVSTAEAYLQPLYALASERSPCAVVLSDVAQNVVSIDNNFPPQLERLL